MKGNHWPRSAQVFFAALVVAALGMPEAYSDVEHFPSAAMERADGSGQVATQIWGHFDKPSGSGPFPAVVLMHGCSGLHQTTARWAAILNEAGYATLVLDSFGPRSVFSACSSASNKASPAKRALDAYGALAFLLRQPDIAPSKIALAGWSHGAIAALGAVAASGISTRFDRKFAAAIAFYPYCIADRSYELPVLLLIGEADDWIPAAPCKTMFEKNAGQGGMLEIVTYAGARHGFDDEALRHGIEFPGAFGNTHFLKFDEDAYRDSIVQVTTFLSKHLCD